MTETTSTGLTPTRSEVERAVLFGVRAPSIHNTQPWRWVYRRGVLELYADRSRQLPALDPDGRSVLLSCGAALELARLGFAVGGWRTVVERLPDPDRPDLLARIRAVAGPPLEPVTVERAGAAERRHTERRPFLVDPVADEAVRSLLAVATDSGVYAYAVQRADERLDLAVVFSWADGVELADPALPGRAGALDPPGRRRRRAATGCRAAAVDGCRPRRCRTCRPGRRGTPTCRCGTSRPASPAACS